MPANGYTELNRAYRLGPQKELAPWPQLPRKAPRLAALSILVFTHSVALAAVVIPIPTAQMS